MKIPLNHKEVVTDIPFQEIPAPEMNTDETWHIRMGWWIVIVGVGGFMLWASLAPLDKGVPLSGTVAVASSRKAIQHPTGGIIEEILVKEGHTVKAGQILITMNATQAKALAEISRVQYFTARAVEARLTAERDGAGSIRFPTEMEDARHDPRVMANINLQNQLFVSRRNAIQGELRILKEQLDSMRDLADEGYVARNRMLDIERLYFQQKQTYQKEVGTQLAEAQKEAEGLRTRLVSQDFDLANVEVRAPVDGTVVGLSVFTRGGVIAPGFKLMEIVPSEDALVVEGQVPVHLIDKVHPDLKVELIFSAFNQNLTPHVPGIVTHVSADRLIDEVSRLPYYQIKAKVAPEGMKMIANLQVRPGMPVELFVKTGERTLLNYLLKPILDHIKMAMTEE
ncbi:MAG: HlyD family efflux transporter periplasmic adaptor subunit [Verrucomicrobiota bacterium]